VFSHKIDHESGGRGTHKFDLEGARQILIQVYQIMARIYSAEIMFCTVLLPVVEVEMTLSSFIVLAAKSATSLTPPFQTRGYDSLAETLETTSSLT
jgi:hypothetical protein